MDDQYVRNQIRGVKDWYEKVAVDFQNRYSGMEGEYLADFEDRVYDGLVQYRNKILLDLGTGGGRLAIRVAPQVNHVYGVDISEHMIQIANTNKGSITNAFFEVGDATKLRFVDGYFNLVVSAGMFEYLSDPAPFLVETARVLDHNGEFIFTCHKANEHGLVKRIEGVLARWLFSHHFNSAASFYASNTHLRDSLFEKAYHRIEDLTKVLDLCGFTVLEYRTTFLTLPTHLYYWAAERDYRSVQRFAIWLNQFLGRCSWTKRIGNVMVIKAKKCT